MRQLCQSGSSRSLKPRRAKGSEQSGAGIGRTVLGVSLRGVDDGIAPLLQGLLIVLHEPQNFELVLFLERSKTFDAIVANVQYFQLLKLRYHCQVAWAEEETAKTPLMGQFIGAGDGDCYARAPGNFSQNQGWFLMPVSKAMDRQRRDD
jgi:hypothetical protein